MRQKYPFLSYLACGRLLALAATLLFLIPATQVAHASDIVATRTALATEPLGDSGAKLTATVTTATGSPVTGGTVDFVLASGQSLGSAIVGADGTASLSVTKLPPASTTTMQGSAALPLAAHYSDSGDFAASLSPATTVAAPQATTSAAPDFSFTGSPTTLTVTAGGYGSTVLTVASIGGFTGPVQFSCQDLPAQVTCAFNPTQQTLAANGTFTSTLQLGTQAPSGTASSAIERHSAVALACALPGALALLGLARRRRSRSIQWLAVALLVGGTTLGLSGCSQRYGYLHHPPTVATGTPAGTYSITVTANGDLVSSAIQHTLTISLVVQ